MRRHSVGQVPDLPRIRFVARASRRAASTFVSASGINEIVPLCHLSKSSSWIFASVLLSRYFTITGV